MSATYNTVPTLLSLCVAIFGCVSALALSAQLGRSSPHPWQKVLAVLNGGVALGAAIWSTHYLAMTAVRFPGLASQELVNAVTGIGIAVVAAWAGLYVAGRQRLGAISIPIGGTLVGLGIVGMHYRGVWHVPECEALCDRHLTLAAAGVVILASMVALTIALHKPSAWKFLAGGVVQGLAVTLMSYAAMAGTFVVPSETEAVHSALPLSENLAPYAIASGSLLASLGSFALLALIAKDSMTREQIALVQQTFNIIEQNAAHAGDLFYERLFELRPEVRSLFPNDLTDQKGKLLAVLAGAVLNLHRLEEVLPVVRDLGKRHINYGVEPDHYKAVGEALLWTMERVLADQYTPAVRKAWSAAYTMLASVMIAAAAAAEAAPEKKRLTQRFFWRRAA
jgi:hemoglobin-like flavoprotein/NO-binding membrane sensor protein with MHYT domain